MPSLVTLVLPYFSLLRSLWGWSVLFFYTLILTYAFIWWFDNNIIIDDNFDGTHRLNYTHSQFQMKDVGLFKYLLGIEVVQSSSNIVNSER